MRAVLRMVAGMVLFAAVQAGGVAAPSSVYPPMDTCDIVRLVSFYNIPRLDLQKATLKEALEFMRHRLDDIEREDNPTSCTFEYRLPEEILSRKVSFQAKDIRMIDAIKKTLAGVPVALTFEPGKLIFHSPTSAPPR